jgi:hypothetical protein
MEDNDNKIPPTNIPPTDSESTEAKIIPFIPKQIKQIEANQDKQKEIWMRRSLCEFSNLTQLGGCKCNYCTYFKMMGHRIYDLIASDLHYQAKKGTMIFTSQDVLDILKVAMEKLVQVEESHKPKPPGK